MPLPNIVRSFFSFGNPKKQKDPLFESLEDRTMFDASSFAGELVVSPSVDPDFTRVDSPNALEATPPPTVNLVENSEREFVFVDTTVEGYQGLVDGFLRQGRNVSVVLLNSNGDGLEQMAKVLSGEKDVSAIHLISHGDRAELKIGSEQIDFQKLNDRQVSAWTTIGESLSQTADFLVYGCNFAQGDDGLRAAKELSSLTGADVAASNDLTGLTSLGGDWVLEETIGSIETSIIVGINGQNSFNNTLALAGATLSIVSDGTPVWDGDNNAGNDMDGANGIIRTHDTIAMEVFYNTDSGGATDLSFTSILPDGLVWDRVPAAAALDSRTMIFDSVTGLEGGDMRGIIAYLPDVDTTFTSSVALEARALGGAQGTALNGVSFEVDSSENATPLMTEAFDFTLSAAANMDIRLLNPSFRGVHTDASGTQDGVVYTYSIGMFGAHPTRTGSDGVKGSAPIEDNFTFDIDLSAVTPGATIFDWGQALGPNSEYALDGITRNYERFINAAGNVSTSWSHSSYPTGQVDEALSTAWTPPHSTPDSGDWTITGSAGSVHTAQVSGADTTGVSFPTFGAGNRVLPADERWFTSSQVSVWIPIDDILPGEDGISGTADDGLLQVTPELTNFDPDDAYGITNNFGDGVTEDTSNNDYTHTIYAFNLGGFGKYNAQEGHPTSGRWVDTGTYWGSGDAETSVGHTYDARVSSGKNNGVLSLEGAIFGDKFDNSATKITANSLPAQSGDGWSRIYVSGGPFNGTHLTYGTDYIIEFGTGGVGGAAGGWTDWDSMGDATLADSESPVWSEDPTDVALGGNAYADGVRDSITKYRIILLRDLEPGENLISLVTMETIGHSTLDLANNPGGNIIANMGASSIGYLRDDANLTNDWRTSEYDPENNSYYAPGSAGQVITGDRLWIVDANVDVDKTVVDLGAGNSYLAGSAATIQLNGTVTIPGPDTGSPAKDVYITDMLPAGLTVVGGSANPASGTTFTAGDCSTISVQSVEYWDGSAWSTTWTYGASGIRWYFGDVPLNTTLPTMTFDVLIPFDAMNGQSWTNTAIASSPSDDSSEEFRSSSAGLVAVQVAAMSAGKFVVTPLVPEDTTIIYELGIANVSDDKDVPWFDLVDILPYDADYEGSSINGVYTNVVVSGLDPDLDVYVTTVAGAMLDGLDGTIDGYADPGTAGAGDAWFVAEGTGIWSYTLDDVVNGVAGAPTMAQITAIRVVSDKSIDPFLAPGESTKFFLELTPDGNIGIPSDHYTNKFTARTDPSSLPLPVTSAAVTAVVIAPDIEVQKEVALDETHTNIDPLLDAHWAESVAFDDTDKAYFRLKVTNTGTADFLGATVTDNLPAGATFVAGTAVATTGDVSGFPATWVFDLAVGDTAYLIYQIDVNDSGNYPNTADVDATDQFGESVDDTDDAEANFVTEISASKHQTAAVRSVANPALFEVTYEVEVMNTSVFDLANLMLTEDLFGAFGAGYMGLLTPPAITSSSLSAGATSPTINGGFNGNTGGAGDDDILAGDGLLKPTDSVTITYTVLVDPALLADPANTVNQVEASGVTGGPGGTPTTDLSDDGSDPDSDNPGTRGDDGMGGTDDPTPLALPSIDLTKQVVGAPVPAISGVNGNFDVTYQFMIENTGTTDLDNISMIEDFLANLGGAFVGVVNGPTVTMTTATDNPDFNIDYDGAGDPNIFATVPTVDTFTFGGNDSNTTFDMVLYTGDQRIVIDPNQTYQLMAGAVAGASYDPTSRNYIGIISYDIDGNTISPYHFYRFAGATDTTLAAPLNPGDTTITLSDATGWQNAGATYQRSLAWYGYTDSTGYTYPDYEYTRNILANAWDPGSIAGNVITLRNPWSGPALAAGDAIRNSSSGGTYQYTLLSNGHIDQTSDMFSAPLGGGFNTSGAYNATLFRPGTHSVSALVLADWRFGGTNTELTVSDYQIKAPNTSLLKSGEKVTFEITVEIDPDNVGAIYDGITGDGNGSLENQASVDAQDPFNGGPVADTSDDPTDPTDANYGDDSDPDDPTSLLFPNINLTKSIVGSPVAATSGTFGNVDVTFEFEITNAGNEAIQDLSLTEDFLSQYAGAFVRIVPQGALQAMVSFSDATDGVEINSSFDGGISDAELIDSAGGTNELAKGQSIRIQVVVEVDPDSTTALYTSGMLVNQAMVMGVGAQSGVRTDDDSDDPTDATDNDNDDDNDPDDPTVFEIPIIDLTKTLVGTPTAAASMVAGNFDVVFDFTITNFGNAGMEMLSLVEDVRGQYGTAFVGIVPQAGMVATIQSSTMSDVPEINTNYDGGISDNEVFDNSGANMNLISMGESITVRIVFEVDPDAVGAIHDANGNLVNQAMTTGTHNGTTYSDLSDDPNDATNDDPNSDNNPDDPNLLRIADVDLIKQVSTAMPPTKQPDGTWNVTFELEMINTGSTVLDNLSLLDDISSPSFLGTAWLSTVSTSIDTSGVTTGDLPALNAGWDADPTQNMLDGNGSLNSGDTIKVTFTVNIDPDASGDSSILYNQATVTGEDPVSGGPVDDASDDPTDATNDDPDSDNNPDDPTAIEISDIGVAKQLNNVVDLGTGRWSAEYVIVVENTGTVDLVNVQVDDDLVAEFGGGFIGVISPPSFVSSNLSAGSSVPTMNLGFDGGISDTNLLVAGGLLAPGDNFTFVFTIEMDTLIGDTTGTGDFTNQVNATADGSNGQAAEDDSDAGTNPNTENGSGGEDDATPFRTPQIRAGKTHGVAVQNGDGSYTVPVTIIVENTGNVPLTNLNLFEDIAAQFGNAYIGVANPSIQGVGAFTGTLPTLNGAWVTGDTSPNVIDSTVANELLAGEAFTFTFDVIVDPDGIDGDSQFNNNQVDVSGTGENFDGMPVVVDDQSGDTDDPSDGVDNDNPTPLIIPEVILEKRFLSQALASSGTSGNIDVTYEFVLTNSGTVTLENLGIFDDWDTQFGNAFVGIVDVDLSDGNVTRPPSSGVNGNSNYTGLAADNMLDTLGQLLPGESVTVTLTVEIDPDADPAKLVNGELVNQANATGDYDDPSSPGVDAMVTDLSDDPTDGANNDVEGDGEGDDPTTISVASVELTKDMVGFGPAISGVSGNYDVTFELVVNNTGTETLSNLSVLDDLQSHFGGAFQRVVSIAVVNTGGTTMMPAVNNGYTGAVGSDMLIGAATDALESGQSFTITLVIEMDPDAAGTMDSVTGDGTNDFENSATVEADSQYSGPVDDISDDTSDPTNGDDPSDLDNEGDDPTSFDLPSIDLIKEIVGSPVAATSGVEGNLEVTYDLTITNTGNADLDMLTLTEDLQANYGGAFVRLLGQGSAFASIVSTDAFDAPEISLSFDGTSANSQMFDNTGTNLNLLRTGQFITVRIIIEVDPDSPTAVYSNGALVNQADTTGNHVGMLVSDESDDPNVNGGNDPDGDNNPDDPNTLRIPLVSLEKQVVGTPVQAASGTSGNWDATYEFTITNTGTTQLDMMQLTEDFASNFGGAFVAVVTSPVVTASTAADDPEFNLDYDGGLTDAALFDNTGGNSNLLNVGESVTIQIVIEIDPDNATAIYDAISADGDHDLENQARVTAEDAVTGAIVDDNSDDPTDATDNNDDPTADNDPDDPTDLHIPQIELLKSLVGSPVPATSGVSGNFELTYDLEIVNTGTTQLNMLTLTDDLLMQYGGAFVRIVPQATSPVTIQASTATDDPGINAAYDGGISNSSLFDGSNSQLLTGQTITLRIVIEVDPDAAGATYVNGSLENQAETTGTDEHGTVVDDLSDDPNDFADDNSDPLDDNDPDDPNNVRIPLISLDKEIVGGPGAAISGVNGNYDVTYQLVVTNTGTTPLNMLLLEEDFVANFGGGFVRIVSAPMVTASTATDDPEINADYDGGFSDAQMFDNAGGTNLLNVGESVTIQVIVEVDPDNVTAIYDNVTSDGNNDFENQAMTSGVDPVSGVLVDDDSDDPNDATDSNNDPTSDNDADDPTTFSIPDITLTKSLVGQPVAATSGVIGNWEVTYDLEFLNNGNEALDQLSLIEDLVANYGTAFVQIVTQSGAPAVVMATTATDAIEINAAYDGGLSDSQLINSASGTNLIESGQAITIRIVIEIDPDAPGAIYDGNGNLTNQATVSGTAPDGEVVTDLSDDPNDTEDEGSGDNDPDDPNLIRLPMISLDKSIVGAPVESSSGTAYNWDVTYQLVVTNTGTTQLDMMTLTEDFVANFGGAFVRIVTGPGITASSAADDPEFNTVYDGGIADAQMFDNASGTNLLNVGESVTIQLVVEVDPDNDLAVFDAVTGDGTGDLENQASVTGDDAVTGQNVDDDSDDPTDATNSNNNDDPDPDDHTGLTIPQISLTKTLVGGPVPAASGAIDNWDVVYDLQITNTGNDFLSSLSLIEDLRTQYGGAFVQVVSYNVVASSASDPIELNTAYDGGLSDAQLIDSTTGTNLLETGETVIIRILIEIDPDASGAIYTNGELVNQANTSGTGAVSGATVDDDSDDPNDPTDGSTDGSDNDADDPNTLRMPDISLEKTVVATTAASSGIYANYDVTYEFIVQNTGTTPLDALTLTDDWAGQFGGAFIRIVPGSIAVTNVSAAIAPGANSVYAGGAGENMLDGTGGFDPGQIFKVTVVVEVDPNAIGAIYTNGDLVNQARTTATDYGNPGGAPVSDLSDDTNDATDNDATGDGNPDDVTTVSFSDIGLAKRIVLSEPNGTGQFELTYEFRFRNLGSTDLNNLMLTDEIASTLGPAFQGVVSAPVIVLSTATADPGLDSNFDGDGNADFFDGTSGTLRPGEEIVVQVVVLIDIDQLTISSNNRSTVSGNDGTGTISDESDTGSDPEGTNPNQTGDTGGENDPTLPPAVGIAKDHGTPTPAGPDLQEWAVPVTLNIRNLGLTDLVDLRLIEDIAAQFGGAFVSVDTPVIDASGVSAGIAPGVNTAWTSNTSLNLFDGSGILKPGDVIVITFNVIVDPDFGGTSVPLDNQSIITATDPKNPDLMVIDTSDSGTDPTGTNPGEEGDTGLTEDPTPLVIPDIGLAKQIIDVEQNGLNYDLTFDMVYENTGTVDLMNLRLFDDLATQYGTQFVSILVAPSIVASTATTDPGMNSSYEGDTAQNIFDGASGLLKPGESITIRFTVRATPDFGDPNFAGTITLVNQAQASADDLYGNEATDTSDSGTDPNGQNPGEPGDTGSWADPTPITLDVFAFDANTNEATGENTLSNRVEERENRGRRLTREIFSLARDPIFSGFARPNTQIIGRIYDFQGNLISENRVYTDAGGNWMMQMHELKGFEYYHVEFEHVASGSLDVYGYLGLDPADNTYQTMEMETMSRYLERPTVEGAIQSAAHNKIRMDHKVNNQPLGFGSYTQNDDDRGHHGDRGRD